MFTGPLQQLLTICESERLRYQQDERHAQPAGPVAEAETQIRPAAPPSPGGASTSWWIARTATRRLTEDLPLCQNSHV